MIILGNVAETAQGPQTEDLCLSVPTSRILVFEGPILAPLARETTLCELL